MILGELCNFAGVCFCPSAVISSSGNVQHTHSWKPSWSYVSRCLILGPLQRVSDSYGRALRSRLCHTFPFLLTGNAEFLWLAWLRPVYREYLSLDLSDASYRLRLTILFQLGWVGRHCSERYVYYEYSCHNALHRTYGGRNVIFAYSLHLFTNRAPRSIYWTDHRVSKVVLGSWVSGIWHRAYCCGLGHHLLLCAPVSHPRSHTLLSQVHNNIMLRKLREEEYAVVHSRVQHDRWYQCQCHHRFRICDRDKRIR